MKKTVIPMIIVITILLSSVMPTFAATMNVSDEIGVILNYYTKETTEVTEWDEIVSFAAVNAIQGTALPDPKLSENDPFTTACFLLERLSCKVKPHTKLGDTDPVEMLSSAQIKDKNSEDHGSFGCKDLFKDLICFISMKACQTADGNDTVLYSAQSSVRYVLSKQNKNGSFDDDIKTHCLAISYLSVFTDDADAVKAIDEAIGYLKDVLNDKTKIKEMSTEGLGFAVCALTDSGRTSTADTFPEYGDVLSVLLARKNNDGSYAKKVGDTSYDENSTLAALKAYDAVSNKKSVYRRLTDYGAINEKMFEKLKWFILAFAILVLLSVVFWFYIMFGRKKYADDPKGQV